MASQCNRAFDYFVICGLDNSVGLEAASSLASIPGDEDEAFQQPSPLERSYRCKILGHYPKSVAWNEFDSDAISTLCLPHGLEFRTQKHKLDPYFHGFTVTREDGSRYYGFSFTFYEEVKDSKICTALHALQSMHIAEASRGGNDEKRCPPSPLVSANTRSLPRHFRLSPLADKHAGDANKYYDIGKDQLFASKAIAVISQFPFVHLAREFLSGLHRLVMRDNVAGLCIEDYVYNILCGVPLPEPGTSIGVKLWSSSSPLLCLQLPADEELPILEFPLRIIFSLLPPRPLLQLFTSVLLENQVLLFSREFNRLFMVAECITALLFPFSWEHVYVPIVPASLMHFLDAPVPYIMGLQCSRRSRQGLDFTSQASLCVVDIDQGKVEVPEDTPALPKHDELLREMTSLLAQYGMKEPYDKNRNTRLYHRYSGRRRKNSWCQDSDSGLSSDRSTSPNSLTHRNHSSSSNVVSVLASPRISSAQRGSRIAAGLQNQRRARRSTSADANGAGSEDDTSLADEDDDDDFFYGNESWGPGASANNARLPPSGAQQANIRQSDSFKRIQAALGADRGESPGQQGSGSGAKSSRNIRDARFVADMKLNNGVRQVFLRQFTAMFSSYENFVIQPTQDLEGWLCNRESMQNFDKSTYLGDQPFHHRPFLSRFLETQMFTSFIDAKILEHFGQPNPRVKFFEQRIARLK